MSLNQTLRRKTTLKAVKKYLTLNTNLYLAISIPDDILEDVKEVLVDVRGYNENEAAKTAPREALNEWIAANTVDFMNEIKIIYDIVKDRYTKEFSQPGKGFPPRMKFTLPGSSIMHGPDYIEQVLSWIDDQIENPFIFPESEKDIFPEDFVETYVSVIFKRILRIFAIFYALCVGYLQEDHAERHLNTCFKHFYYFIKRYELVPDLKRELLAFNNDNAKKQISLKELDEKYEKDKTKALASSK